MFLKMNNSKIPMLTYDLQFYLKFPPFWLKYYYLPSPCKLKGVGRYVYVF